MTLPDLRRRSSGTCSMQRVQQTDVMDKISVTEEEAHAYYDAHRDEFTTPAELTLREILIEVPASDRGVNVAEDDAAKAKAEDVRHRLLARRAVRAAGRRSLRRAVESQRRTDRAAQQRRARAGAAEADLAAMKVGDVSRRRCARRAAISS